MEFDDPYITEVKIEKLDFGDYACEFEDGYRPPVVFEKKELGDLFQTLTRNYPRFKKEIIRAHEKENLLVIVIEATTEKIFEGYSHCSRNGCEVFSQLCTLCVRYRVPFIPFKNRWEISQYITGIYLACGREHIRKCQTSGSSTEKSS